MGVVVVGPSGSGKTILWKLLRAALGKLDQVVKQYTMNPKAMPRTQVRTLHFACLRSLYGNRFKLFNKLLIKILSIKNLRFFQKHVQPLQQGYTLSAWVALSYE